MNINEFLINLFGSADSSEEYDQIEQWNEETMANAKSLKGMLKVNEDSADLNGYKDFDVESALKLNMAMIEEESSTQPTSPKKSLAKSILLLLAGLLMISIGVFTVSKWKTSSQVEYANVPGQSILSNGAHITLNENSTYSYDRLTNSLDLKGEAYFNVSKQEIPFVINTDHGSITVVGTEFNVKSSAEETEVFMHEGIVRFDSENQSVSLKIGDLLRASNELHVQQNQKSQLFSYWHKKNLEYNNVALTTVLFDINRLYGESLSAENVNSDEIFITSSFEGNSLEEIVMIIEKIANISIK